MHQFKSLLDSTGTKFIVALYPDEFQVNEDLLHKLFATYNMQQEDYDIDFVQKILSEHLNLLQVPYIEFLEDFRPKRKTTPLYLERNTHWNDAGNELAAELLFRYLLDNGYLEKKQPADADAVNTESSSEERSD